MSFTGQEFVPKPRNWFDSHPVYEGFGYAEFDKIRGWVKGLTRVVFSSDGTVDIEMNVEHFKVEEELEILNKYVFEQIVLGMRVVHEAGMYSMPISWDWLDHCSKLEVRTQDGTFVVNSRIKHQYYGLNRSIRFTCSESEFFVDSGANASFWVLPLSNFISDVGGYTDYFDSHPLRLHDIPPVPTNLTSDEEIFVANHNRSIKNDLIVFKFGETYSFIERLPNYKELEKNLKNKESTYEITALMIGDVGELSTELENLKFWIPINLLNVLTLALGIKIGSSWIELRDMNGNLIKRIHKSVRKFEYNQGFIVIHQPVHYGLGQLLTQALNSPFLDNEGFRTAADLVISATQGVHETNENRLAFLFRAFDTLCEADGIYERRYFELDPSREASIATILREAQNKIKLIAQEAENEGRLAEAKAIRDKISQRVSGALSRTRLTFGAAIGELLDEYSMLDGEIVQRYFEVNPREDGYTWLRLIDMYRGKAIHINLLDIKGNEEKGDEIASLFRHLLDILIRILLKKLKYEGKYQPAVKSYLTEKYTINWVNSYTTVQDLGYKTTRRKENGRPGY